jgi:hypothetical protein
MKFRNGRSDIIFILDVTESQEAMKLLSNNSSVRGTGGAS